MAMSTSELLDVFKSMTVLELNEFLKAFEEEFDVTAAAPVAVAAAAAPGGFGLGLASVQRSLVLMGGAAGHEPRWTGGAAFWLRLPLAAEEDGALCEAA